MGKLEIVVGNEKYPLLEIPAEVSTVGSWKALVAQGFLGTKVLYAEKLTCLGAQEKALGESTSVPAAPAQMRVSGPRSILGMFQMALRKKVGAPKLLVEAVKIRPPPKKKTGWPWVGKYHVTRTIGSGFMGPCVYEAESVVDNTKVALKWPANRDEVNVLQEIAKKMPSGCRGIPTLLSSGRHENKSFVVLQLFRQPLQSFFPRIWARPKEERWPVTRVLGRLLLRRLEALHSCGFVHCDISPENILLGRHGRTDFDPHILDFGLARPYPDGGKLAGEHGSGEWSSIRSADGGERLPEDDLESLGWLLMNCVHSVLPWFASLELAYEKWHVPQTREGVVKQVQAMKRNFLNEGWKAVERKWCADQPSPPEDLFRFILACQTAVAPPSKPDYARLAGLLGADPSLDADRADEEDIKFWEKEFPNQ